MVLVLLSAMLPILLALALGFVIGMRMAVRWQQRLVASMGYLVWALLLVIGYQFAAVMIRPETAQLILKQAFIYATLISVLSFVLLCFKPEQRTAGQADFSALYQPLKQCGIAILWVVAGMLVYQLSSQHFAVHDLSNGLLYLLICLVGVDLAKVKFQQMTAAYLMVPLITLLALLLAAFCGSLFLHKSLLELLVVGSGLGWFSLAGSMVGQLLGAELGSLAFLTNLIREFYAILFLYCFGSRYAYGSLAVCAATAMDSSLPFVKQNCRAEHVQLAIFVGFVMSLLAPVLIVVFASLL